MKWRLGSIALIIFLLGLTGCSTHTGPTAAGMDGQGKATYAYRIGPEDVLAISVWQNDEISRTVPVRPDGMISLPLLHDVQAAGLTPEQLRDVLKQQLEEYIPHVEVSVIVTKVQSFKVSILGGVTSPARYTFQDCATILEALAQAGGLADFAARTRIVVLRKEGETTKCLRFNYDKAITNGGEENFALRPGDIVMVPLTKF